MSKTVVNATLQHCANNYAQEVGLDHSKNVRDFSKSELEHFCVVFVIEHIQSVIRVQITGRRAEEVIDNVIKEVEFFISVNTRPMLVDMDKVLDIFVVYGIDILGTPGRYCGPVIPRQTWRQKIKDFHAARSSRSSLR